MVGMEMNNERLFAGLFQRLHGSGLHPVLSGELAAANYPTDEHRPLRAVRCRQEAVHWHTENYLDKGSGSLDDTWLSIWGSTPLDYMGVAPGSPGARELGLGSAPAGSTVAPNAGPSVTLPSPAVDSRGPTVVPAPTEAASFANGFWYRDGSTLKRLYSGAALPASAPPMATFFADLVCGVSWGMPGLIDEEVRKGYKRLGFYPKAPAGWDEDLLAVSIGFTVYMLSREADSDLLVTGAVGDHYRKLLAQVHPDLKAFVQADVTAEPSQMLVKLGRIMSELAGRRGVKLTKDVIELPVVALGALAGGRHALDRMGRALPITGTEALQKVAASRATRVSMPYGRATAAAASVPEPTLRTFAEWRTFCLQLADRRAVPRRFAEDLIPAESDLDWHVKPLRQFEDLLEQAFPGRRDWLAREGATPADFARFWSRPPWVQNYIEALVNLNVQLEIRGQLDRGEHENLAYSIAAASLPIYGNEPDLADRQGLKVPWELFDRVEAYWAKLDMPEIERGAIDRGWSTAAARIRAEVAAGAL